MLGRVSRARCALVIVATCALALLSGVVFPGHAGAQALRTPQISLDPNQGAAGTVVNIQGKDFPTLCFGHIFIDGNDTGQAYSCGGGDNFQTQLTWPDGLDPGKHSVAARGIFGGSHASATFTQVELSPTPDASATAAAGATATAGAAQATATVQAQATSTAVAVKDSATSTGNPPGSGITLSSAMLALLGIVALLLVASVILIALALSNRSPHPQVASPYRRSAGTPPPPPGVPTSPDDPWVWPTDPDQR
jgi:hypothetical protein